MYRLILASVFLFSAVAVSYGQAPKEFSGKLDPQLSPDMVHVDERVYHAAALSGFRFETAPPDGTVVSAGALIDYRAASNKTLMLIVEPPKGKPFLWVDGNANGIYETAEQFPMSPVEGTNQLSTVIRLPIKNAYFKDYPIYVRYFRGFSHPDLAATDRLIEQSVYALAYGRVQVGDRKVLFQYPFPPGENGINPTEGLFGVDVDGNGRIRDEQFSVETSYTSGQEAVFPLGDIYVSTTRIDMPTGTITVRRREKSDYTRVDLEVGREMPDFTFTDLAGKERKLSDFRGKYLMVDFWGVWCGDCTRETPFHLEAYKRFRKRGFEILGVDSDESIETVKAYVAKNKMTWPQATNDSTKRLQQVDYRLQEYPSTILLGPDGKVLVLNQRLLHGDALLQTLDRFLPK